MNKFHRILFLWAGLLLLGGTGDLPVRADEAVQPQIRALWVDAFREGAKSPTQIDRLIQNAVTANLNTLIVQVRRRGDAYYNQSIEPRTEDLDLPIGFDSLQYLIDKAHANRLEVHAWLNTLVAWNSSVPPKDPNHVWNLHGPGASDRDTWVSYYRSSNKTEALTPSFYLDPGNPAVVDYTAAVYLNVLKNYDVDGIHLDYSRYAGIGWGYNPTSVARYNARFERAGMPASDDPQWAEWRREQTANLVRKIYLQAIAVKPNLKVSSAVISWGDGPVAEGDWEKSRAYAQVFQDWRRWLTEGIIDLVIPMNYFDEWNPAHQLWYNQWIEWEKDHSSNRQIVIGIGNYSQYIEDTLAQISRAQAPSAAGNYTAGVCLFSYGASHLYSNNDYKENGPARRLPRQPHQYRPDTNDWLFELLARPGGYTDPVLNSQIATVPVFPTPAAIPEMPWKTRPVNGYLMGTVAGPDGAVYDHLKLTVESWEAPGSDVANPNPAKIRREVYTDGSGWFGLAELPAGHYLVWIDKTDFAGQRLLAVKIEAGRVSEVNFRSVQGSL